MEPTVENSNRKAFFCFIDELDHLEHELDKPHERSDFINHVITQHNLKDVMGERLSLKRMDSILRRYWQKTILGQCSKTTKGMSNLLFKEGSKALPDGLLTNLGYDTWVSDNGIPQSTFTVTDLDSPRSKSANETRTQNERNYSMDRLAREVGADGFGKNDNTKRKGSSNEAPARKRQKTSETTANSPAQTRARAHLSEGARGRNNVNMKTTALSDSSKSNLGPSGLVDGTASMGIEKSSELRSTNKAQRCDHQEDDQTTALGQAKTTPADEEGDITFVDDGMPRMAKGEVIAGIKQVWNRTTSFQGAFCHGSQINECSEIELVIEARDHLQMVYKELFGQKWESNALRIIQSERCPPIEFIHGCLGASISCLILNHELPWKGAKALMADFDYLEGFIDKALTKCRQQTSMQSLITQAAHYQVNDERFRQTTIEQAADQLSAKFMLAIRRQLTLLKADRAKKGSSFALHDQIRFVKRAFLEALILKGQLEATADEYSFHWIEGGKEFDEEEMEDIKLGKDDRCVAWCAFPKVVCKYEGDDFETLVSKAKVYTMAKLA